MKRIIALIIVAVMCLSIASCGASKKEKLYDKYEKVIDALEDKDYENAVGEIYKLYQEDQEAETDDKWGIGSSSDGDADETEEEADPEAEALKAALTGEWLPSQYVAEEKGFSSFILNEDGTVTIGEDDLTWSIEYINGSYADIEVKEGDTNVYYISVSKYEDGSFHMSMSKCIDENSYTSIGTFYRAADYTKLEITAENWDEYFELYETSTIYEDAFGDPTSIGVRRDMVLKEEYGQINDDLSKTVIEYSYRNHIVKYTADLESGTYTRGGIVDDRLDSDPYTETVQLRNLYYGDEEPQRYGLDFSSFTIAEFPEQDVWENTDFTVTRIISEVYVYNTAE